MASEDRLFHEGMRAVTRHVLPVFRPSISDGLFSAVAVQLGQRYFLLTAGHCIDPKDAAGEWFIGAPARSFEFRS